MATSIKKTERGPVTEFAKRAALILLFISPAPAILALMHLAGLMNRHPNMTDTLWGQVIFWEMMGVMAITLVVIILTLRVLTAPTLSVGLLQPTRRQAPVLGARFQAPPPLPAPTIHYVKERAWWQFWKR
jgi:hypothetical protein